MITRIHVNQHNIKHNAKSEELKPVLTVKTYKENKIGNEAVIKDKQGNILGRFVYSPDKPFYCEVRYYHTDYVEELKAEIYSLQRKVAMLNKSESDLLRKLAKRR